MSIRKNCVETNPYAEKWLLELGRAIQVEFGLKVGSEIDHQCGTVWVGDLAITSMKTEE
jgi:hypothetical protein